MQKVGLLRNMREGIFVVPFTDLSKWRTFRPTLDRAAAITDSTKPLYNKWKQTEINPTFYMVRGVHWKYESNTYRPIWAWYKALFDPWEQACSGKETKKKTNNKKKERKGDQYCRPHLRDVDIKLLFLWVHPERLLWQLKTSWTP